MLAPLGWVYHILLEPTPVKLRPFDFIMLVVLLVASTKGNKRGASVAPMKQALLLMFGTTVLWFLFGVARGGDARFASWQTYLILSSVLVAFTVAATFRTAADFSGLAKWLLAAAIYRAIMCWLSHFTWARSLAGQGGAYLTSHDDTILWVVSILVLVLNVFDKRSLGVALRNLAIILFLIGAIQWNGRRLAWLSLVMGLLVMYALFPQGAAKRRVNRAGKIAAPVLLVYILVGWGSQNALFSPLRSISTVSTQEDASTQARNVENLGLIVTANGANFALGTGWGKPYIPVSTKYDISGFELWQYVPHNSILGLLAFTGVLGFAGFWLALPTAMFFLSRTARLGNAQDARNVALIGAAQLVVCANQLYGDMGIFFNKPMYAIAVSCAMALRLPLVADVWRAPNSKTIVRAQ
jgi:hypothetical protein